MKLLMMSFAACALLMTSCAEQEIIENVLDGQGELTFSTGIGKQTTKAAELTNPKLQAAAETDGVTVYTYENKDATWTKWFADEVIHKDLQWKLKESVRFRNQNATKFITYFSTKKDATDQPLLTPDVATFNGATFVKPTGVFPKFAYKVNTTSENQEDLIAGITDVIGNQTNITLGLRHILSQVNFGTVGYQGAHIRIADIQIEGVGNSATYTYGADESGTVPNIIGAWDSPTTTTTKYSYYNNTNAEVAAAGNLAANPQANVPTLMKDVMKVVPGDIYLFGDGGNAGPGRKTTIWYPTGKTDPAWVNAHATNPTSLDNSLMLLPQTLTDNAKVTFKYQITDVDNTYVVGGPNDSDWETGEFKLNFKTGDIIGEHYMGKWEQNFRYVYLIDFTDFLDGNALTFNVDVEMYPWVNYDNNGNNNGGVEIMVAGQPTTANMDAIVKGDTWYIASQSKDNPTTPKPEKWAQVIRNEVWNLSTYNFTEIEKAETFTLSFLNVIFNTSEKPATGSPTQIDLILPEGFSATGGIGITISGTTPNYSIEGGNRTATATIIITNDNYYRTSATLEAAIAGATVSGTTLYYGGKEAIDLKTMEPTALTATGNTISVKFNSLIIPTDGNTTNGTWVWNSATRIATWTRK